MSKTLIDVDDEALALVMAHYGTRVKREAINRALREVAGLRAAETPDLEDWIADVGSRLGTMDDGAAWRQ
ncbi:antitoxin of type II TA system, VapB [Modestobacter sp. DSM 44400]|uniref:type II toxin-antitoxin system VapB family antitoxin n=1 Tax=Modestobacter sp. DSM 44400 TaxID=1550230 RepID=UPI00089D0A79|nr:type II toxin-antitoxin system VapB family antitoxin [Modestobacter sp. DSM 44400]SDY82822.1 antitoxin of type II TA system, VapB [Modestobacter sp. DSM 44400]